MYLYRTLVSTYVTVIILSTVLILRVCMYLYSTLVSTHVTVIILSTVPMLMVLYVSVQHTGEYTRDCYYTICSSYIDGGVCIYTAHW
jgi:hypothetical protein